MSLQKLNLKVKIYLLIIFSLPTSWNSFMVDTHIELDNINVIMNIQVTTWKELGLLNNCNNAETLFKKASEIKSTGCERNNFVISAKLLVDLLYNRLVLR